MTRSISSVVCAALLIGGCASRPISFDECSRVPDVFGQLDCMAQSTFPDLSRTARSAIVGTVLGGALTFAVTRGRAGAGLLVRGAAYGGIAGAAKGYLDDLSARSGGDPARIDAANRANFSADTRKFASLADISQAAQSEINAQLDSSHSTPIAAASIEEINRRLDELDAISAHIQTTMTLYSSAYALRSTALTGAEARKMHDLEAACQQAQAENRVLKARLQALSALVRGPG